MARLARAVFPGIPHHVTQRGNGRQQTFFADQDYADSPNLYAYVANDPINLGDPSGTTACTGSRIAQACMNTTGQGHIAGGMMGHSSLGYRMQTPTFAATSWEQAAATLNQWQQQTGAYIPRSSLQQIASAVTFEGSAQVVTWAGACKGRFNCENYIGADLAPKLRIFGNVTFKTMMLQAWMRALALGREVAFGCRSLGMGFKWVSNQSTRRCWILDS